MPDSSISLHHFRFYPDTQVVPIQHMWTNIAPRAPSVYTSSNHGTIFTGCGQLSRLVTSPNPSKLLSLHNLLCSKILTAPADVG